MQSREFRRRVSKVSGNKEKEKKELLSALGSKDLNSKVTLAQRIALFRLEFGKEVADEKSQVNDEIMAIIKDYFTGPEKDNHLFDELLREAVERGALESVGQLAEKLPVNYEKIWVKNIRNLIDAINQLDVINVRRLAKMPGVAKSTKEKRFIHQLVGVVINKGVEGDHIPKAIAIFNLLREICPIDEVFDGQTPFFMAFQAGVHPAFLSAFINAGCSFYPALSAQASKGLSSTAMTVSLTAPDSKRSNEDNVPIVNIAKQIGKKPNPSPHEIIALGLILVFSKKRAARLKLKEEHFNVVCDQLECALGIFVEKCNADSSAIKSLVNLFDYDVCVLIDNLYHNRENFSEPFDRFLDDVSNRIQYLKENESFSKELTSLVDAPVSDEKNYHFPADKKYHEGFRALENQSVTSAVLFSDAIAELLVERFNETELPRRIRFRLNDLVEKVISHFSARYERGAVERTSKIRMDLMLENAVLVGKKNTILTILNYFDSFVNVDIQSAIMQVVEKFQKTTEESIQACLQCMLSFVAIPFESGIDAQLISKEIDARKRALPLNEEELELERKAHLDQLKGKDDATKKFLTEVYEQKLAEPISKFEEKIKACASMCDGHEMMRVLSRVKDNKDESARFNPLIELWAACTMNAKNKEWMDSIVQAMVILQHVVSSKVSPDYAVRYAVAGCRLVFQDQNLESRKVFLPIFCRLLGISTDKEMINLEELVLRFRYAQPQVMRHMQSNKKLLFSRKGFDSASWNAALGITDAAIAKTKQPVVVSVATQSLLQGAQRQETSQSFPGLPYMAKAL